MGPAGRASIQLFGLGSGIADSGRARGEPIIVKTPRDHQSGVAPTLASRFDSSQQRTANSTILGMSISNSLKMRMRKQR